MTRAELPENSVSYILAMQKTKVLVLGDILLDAYITGKVSRISPEAPVPVVHASTERFVAGGAANVAANVAAFGANVWLCGRIGKDADGERIVGICKELNISTPFLIASDAVPTIRKTRILAGYQQIVRIDQEVNEDITESEQKLILKYLEEFLSFVGNKVVIVSDYSKGFLPRKLLQTAITTCRKHNVPVVTDPKSADISRYAGSTVMKPDMRDGRSALRTFMPQFVANGFEQETEAICDCFLTHAAVDNVVLSMSEHGVLIKGTHVPEKKGVRLASRALQVADVSGAGDTVVSFLAMAVGARIPLAKAAELANVAAGIVCGKPGTATLSVTEFLDALSTAPAASAEGKILSGEQVSIVAAQHKQLGKKIVFTNGCFDILHAGHVRLLNQARKLGDMLIVGVNSDASVKRLKGEKRPLQNCHDRLEILAALSCTDFVVAFEEDTPLELILGIRPDILVKGGDYKADDIVGAQEIKTWGGQVEIVPLVEGRSTTSIVSRGNLS